MKKFFLFSLSLLLLTTAVYSEEVIDHGNWDKILKANVKEGWVDYPGIRVNRGGDLYKYISDLETIDVKSLEEKEKLVFWINGYNAHVIRLILANPQIKKLSLTADMYEEKFKIGRLKINLNTIYDRMLRGDPAKGGRADKYSVEAWNPAYLFMLCNGARGGPRLKNQAFHIVETDQQALERADAFVNDPSVVKVQGNQLVLPEFFKWTEKDFDSVGGVKSFLTNMIDPNQREDAESLKQKIEESYPGQVTYQYDWTVNNIQNK